MMTDQLNRAMTLLTEMLHVIDVRPDAHKGQWYKAAHQLVSEWRDRQDGNVVYQLNVAGAWEDLSLGDYQAAMRFPDVKLRVLYAAPSRVELTDTIHGAIITFTEDAANRLDAELYVDDYDKERRAFNRGINTAEAIIINMDVADIIEKFLMDEPQ